MVDITYGRDQSKESLEYYFHTMASLHRTMNQEKLLRDDVQPVLNYDDGSRVAAEATDEQRRAFTREVFSLLWNARLFVFEPHVYLYAYRQAEMYTTEVLAGYRYRPAGSEAPPKEEAEAYMAKILKECKHVEFPQRWPFETVYIGLGQGVHISASDFMVRMEHYRQFFRTDIVAAVVRGYVITQKDDGTVIELVEYEQADGSSSLIPEIIRTKGNWIRSYSLVPWMVQIFAHVLEQYRTFIKEVTYTPGQRRDLQKKAKQARMTFLPKPYYVLRMSSKVLEEQERNAAAGPSFRYTYRFDVRGHERVKVQRGPLPIPPKVEEKLRKRGYQIFLLDIEDDYLRKLFQRHIAPKRPDEWIAVKSTWVKPHQKGPEDAAYVPAIRVPGKT
jgi:hypothetical protein